MANCEPLKIAGYRNQQCPISAMTLARAIEETNFLVFIRLPASVLDFFLGLDIMSYCKLKVKLYWRELLVAITPW